MSPSPELVKARETARELVSELLAEPVEVECTESPSIVLLASLIVKAAPPEKAAEAARHAIAAAKEKEAKEEKPEGKGEKRETVDRGEQRRKLRGELAKVEPWTLIEHVRRSAQISTRTRYNLACYCTTLGHLSAEHRDEAFELALGSLEFALVGSGLAEWAGKDPSLRSLRAERAKEFKAIVERHTVAPHDGGSDESAPPPAPPSPPAPAAPAAPAAPKTNVLPLLLELIAEVRAEGAEPGDAEDPFGYVIRGERRDVLVLESESPRLAEIDALFAAAEAWDRRGPRLVIAIAADYDGPPEIRRGELLIELHPLAEAK